jgi:serine/threonine protein kinase
MSAANSHAPEIVGNYIVDHALAHGSMGTVYVARHSLTYARVALKVLRNDLTADKQAEERFLREVRAAAQIGHDGIVKVQDAGKTPEGHLYLAMELLTGETLEDRIARSPGERLTAMEWLLAVLEPLAAAHERSIVHRDLKPANVFIARSPDGSEHIKLLDFGLARDTREKSGTQTGIALGTPYYMSPEQAARPKDVSPASDVWSMGVMMYEVLTGCMPFDGETLHAVVIQAATMAHIPARDRALSLDPELAALVDACLSKQPHLRPRDAGELRARLYVLLQDDAIRADLATALPANGAYDSEPPREPVHMPFADTAIALAHDSRIQDVHPRVKSSGMGVWISAFAALALLISGFFWVIERSSERAIEARTTPPSRGSSVPAAPRSAVTPVPVARPTPAPADALPEAVPEAPPAAAVESRRDNASPRARAKKAGASATSPAGETQVPVEAAPNTPNAPEAPELPAPEETPPPPAAEQPAPPAANASPEPAPPAEPAAPPENAPPEPEPAPSPPESQVSP